MPMLFNEKPSFSELIARAREVLHCHEANDDDGIVVEGVLHIGSPPNILRKKIPIGRADQWENCEIGYEVPISKFGRGCASGVS